MELKDFEDIDEAVEYLENFHDSLLFSSDDITDQLECVTFAGHHYLTAVANVDAAINQLKLAGLYLAREKAGNF